MVSSTAVVAALLSTGLISLAPNLILLAFPSYAVGEGVSSPFLTLGQALAAGGLLGDVFLHTLPSASGNVEDVEVMVLLGFTLFLMADMLIRSIGGGHSHHSHNDEAEAEVHGDEKKQMNGGNNKNNDNNSSPQPKTSVVVLNLVADALHNFTDGLAIGASFALAKNTTADMSVSSLLLSRGGLATLSILCHEIPHELGDFATLVRAGYSKSQAVQAQFMTAIAAFLGTILSLCLADGWIGERLIYVTAGGFIYLACVTILPEVLEDDRHSIPFRLAQLAAFMAGIGFLYLVYLLEAYDDNHDHGHSHDRHRGHNHGPGELDHGHGHTHNEL
jgi:zinc transporter 7